VPAGECPLTEHDTTVLEMGGGLKIQEWKMREWKYRHETARKGRGWKMQEWKDRHDSAGVENAGVKMRVET